MLRNLWSQACIIECCSSTVCYNICSDLVKVVGELSPSPRHLALSPGCNHLWWVVLWSRAGRGRITEALRIHPHCWRGQEKERNDFLKQCLYRTLVKLVTYVCICNVRGHKRLHYRVFAAISFCDFKSVNSCLWNVILFFSVLKHYFFRGLKYLRKSPMTWKLPKIHCNSIQRKISSIYFRQTEWFQSQKIERNKPFIWSYSN